MNISGLLNEFVILGIPSHWFLIGDKGITDNKTVLRFIDNKWAVYYSQRGDKYNLKTFENEDEACKELLLRMKFKKIGEKNYRKEEI